MHIPIDRPLSQSRTATLPRSGDATTPELCNRRSAISRVSTVQVGLRCGRRVCAAGIAAAAFFFFYLGAVTDPARAGDEDDARIMLFSGRDLWRNGAFVYGGFVLAPSGFDQDGLLLKLLSSGGVYRYEASNLGNPRISGIQLLSQVLPGWRIKRGDAEFNFSSDRISGALFVPG